MRSPIRIPIVGKTDANGNLTLPIKSQLAHHCSLNLAAKGTGTPTWEVDLDGSPELFGSGSKVVLGPMYTYPGQVITLVISAGQPNDQITGTLSGVQADTAEELQLAPGAPQVAGFTIGIVSGEFQVTDLKVTGLTGAANASRYVGATLGGPPTSGSFLQGDFVVDEQWGILWTCTVGGTPGTWKASGPAVLYESYVTSGTVASFNPSSIPAYFRDLEIYSGAITDQASGQSLYVQANGDTAANYSWSGILFLIGGTNVPSSGSGVAQARIGTAGTVYAEARATLQNYAIPLIGTYRQFTSTTWQDSDATGATGLFGGEWKNSANAITSLKVFPSAGSLKAGSWLRVLGVA